MTATASHPIAGLRRLLIAAVALVAIVALAAPAVADAASAGTSLTIEAQSGGFFGYVKSSKSSCESNRTVKLYTQSGRLVGSDIAQPNGPDGMYSISTTRTGKFYAKIAPKSGCKGATSRLVRAQA